MLNIGSIIFPDREILNYPNLYFRGKSYIYSKDFNHIIVKSGGYISTDTYFNAFSIEKWIYYTTVKNLFLNIKCKGTFILKIMNSFMAFDQVVTKVLDVITYDESSDSNIEVDLNSYNNVEGIIYFQIEAITDTLLYKEGGYFSNNIAQLPILGLTICTYKRELYVRKFINNLQNYHQKKYIQAFIVDNGNTLDSSLATSNIHIFSNKNYGGAGGFGRGMLEIKKFNEINGDSCNIDYIILMDDDIYIDFSIFDKLLPFLALRKPEFNNYFFAGTMCSLDDKKVQYERYAKWYGSGFIQMSPNFNLEEKISILKNERIEHLNFTSAGWWFSCYSTNMLTSNNLPFPCFFRGDDMEYTIRNGSNIMTLNGVNVWHEPFYKKYSITSEDYYLIRNTLVINTLYCNWIGPLSNIRYIFKRFAKSIIKYDYSSAELLLKALHDYKEGTKFFRSTNPEELNQKLNKLNHKLIPINQLVPEYVLDNLVDTIVRENDKNKFYKFIRFVTFNGYFIPSFLCRNWAISFVGYGSRAINFYKTKRVLNYEPFSNKGYYTDRNFKKAVSLTLRFIKDTFHYLRQFEVIKKEYQCNFHQLQTKEFWINYLRLDESMLKKDLQLKK